MRNAPVSDDTIKRHLQRAVLEQIVELQPAEPTISELIRMLAEGRDEGEEITEAIHDLEGFGFVRCSGEVVAPTKAGLQAAAFFDI
jgi:hypothetical protein